MNRPGSLFPKGAGARESLRRAGILTVVGIAGLIPAALLVGSAVSKRVVPPMLVHPGLVFGGLGIALCASFVAVTHWELTNEREIFRICCTIRRRPADVVVFFAALVLLTTVLGYLFTENFTAR